MPWTREAIQELMALSTTLILGAVVPLSQDAEIPSTVPDQAANKNQQSVASFYINDSDSLVGFMMFSILSGAEAEILTFCVRPQYQNQGIGSQLMQDFVSTLSFFDCTTCYLDVKENNRSAIHLYENFGFQPVGRRKNYYKSSRGELLSSLLMTLKITI